ncbi:hypothetical protein B0J11DRAFT_534908 [Dendryphion nanum]|uniref:Uncharacterized protein n=1 Tax=Dendryphion nanum TaxID=256645 RepID=A0A9P9DJX4_9PLEO|nr:hypothetical protein B0J11DRAFT_534908 [Dendryphion nanum]
MKGLLQLLRLPIVALLAAAVYAEEDHSTCIEGLINNTDWGVQNNTLGCGSSVELINSQKLSIRQSHGGCQPQTQVFREHEVVRTGTWWGPWRKSSGCLFCEKSSETCDLQLTWGITVTRTLSVGFGLDSLGDVSRAIAGNPSFNLGYSWSESRSEGGTVTCRAPAKSLVSYWTQNQMGWADSRSRTVRKTINSLCQATFVREDWLGTGRSDWPLHGRDTMNYGCSTGAAAEC